MKILVTGSAGFIGGALVKRLIENSNDSSITIVGIDNLSDYYEVSLKKARLEDIKKIAKEYPLVYYKFVECDIANKEALDDLFELYNFDIVVHLAAQDSARDSMNHPEPFLKSNIVGFANILECCRHSSVFHLIYDATYFLDESNEYSQKPLTLYDVTKKSDELLAYSYAKLFNLTVTGLYLSTVYGPYGRPDMAYYKFAEKFTNDETIGVYNHGACLRDYVYIDDVTRAIEKVVNKLPDISRSNKPRYNLYSIGSGVQTNLLDFVHILEKELVAQGLLPKNFNFKSHTKLVDIQPGDVAEVVNTATPLQEAFDYTPEVSLEEGIKKFVEWYKNFKNKKD